MKETLQNEARTNNLRTVLRSLLDIFIIFFGFFIGGAIVRFTPPEYLLYGALDSFIKFLVPVLVATLVLKMRKQSWELLGLNFNQKIKPLLIQSLVFAALIVVVIYFLGLRLLNSLGLPPVEVSDIANIVEGNILAYVSWMIFIVWGSAAIGEELIARGFIMDRLTSIFYWAPAPHLWAAVIQAALFGLGHAYQGATGMILAGTTGLIFALGYFRFKKNLLLVILAHGFVDTLFITLAYLGHLDIFFPV